MEMTYEEFKNKWTTSRNEIEPMVRAFTATLQYYGDAESRMSPRVEMIRSACNILQEYGLTAKWDPAWIVHHFAQNWDTADDVVNWLYHRALHNAGFAPGGSVVEKTIDIKDAYMPLVRINAPEWFARKDFMEWVVARNTATWHDKLTITPAEGDGIYSIAPNMHAHDYSDVFFTWTGIYDGSDAPGGAPPHIPDDIWEFICESMWNLHGMKGEVLIWVSNLG